MASATVKLPVECIHPNTNIHLNTPQLPLPTPTTHKQLKHRLDLYNNKNMLPPHEVGGNEFQIHFCYVDKRVERSTTVAYSISGQLLVGFAGAALCNAYCQTPL